MIGLRSAAGLALVNLVAADAVPAEPAPTDLIGILIQSGPFALFLGLIVIDKIAPTGERNRLRDEVKEYKSDMAKLNSQLLDILPPLTELVPLLRELTNDLSNRDRDRDTPHRGR